MVVAGEGRAKEGGRRFWLAFGEPVGLYGTRAAYQRQGKKDAGFENRAGTKRDQGLPRGILVLVTAANRMLSKKQSTPSRIKLARTKKRGERERKKKSSSEVVGQSRGPAAS